MENFPVLPAADLFICTLRLEVVHCAEYTVLKYEPKCLGSEEKQLRIYEMEHGNCSGLRNAKPEFSRFIEWNKDLFPVYGMETGIFPVYGMELENFSGLRIGD